MKGKVKDEQHAGCVESTCMMLRNRRVIAMVLRKER
jgi:hypothetical protein